MTANRRRKLVLLLVLVSAFVIIRLTGVDDLLTLDSIRKNRELLEAFISRNFTFALLLYTALYIATTALSLPSAGMLSIAGGFLFGALPAFICINIGATTGATLAFLSARYIAGGWIQKRYAEKLAEFNREIERNGRYYLLTLRLIPVFPFFLINLFSGMTKIPLGTFIWTTIVGIIPISIVFVLAGSRLSSIRSVDDIVSGSMLAVFVLLGLAALVPAVIARRRMSGQSKPQ